MRQHMHNMGTASEQPHTWIKSRRVAEVQEEHRLLTLTLPTPSISERCCESVARGEELVEVASACWYIGYAQRESNGRGSGHRSAAKQRGKVLGSYLSIVEGLARLPADHGPTDRRLMLLPNKGTHTGQPDAWRAIAMFSRVISWVRSSHADRFDSRKQCDEIKTETETETCVVPRRGGPTFVSHVAHTRLS